MITRHRRRRRTVPRQNPFTLASLRRTLVVSRLVGEAATAVALGTAIHSNVLFDFSNSRPAMLPGFDRVMSHGPFEVWTRLRSPQRTHRRAARPRNRR